MLTNIIIDDIMNKSHQGDSVQPAESKHASELSREVERLIEKYD